MKIQFKNEQLVLFESALFRTITSLIVGKDYLLLVDPNWLPREIDFIESYIQEIKEDKSCYLLFTHSDYDHIIAYEKFKQFETIASQNFIDNPKKESILAEINTFDDQYYIQRDYPITYPSIKIAIATEETFPLGEDTYHFYQAVGHNSDGIITYNANKQVLIVGDYLSNIEFPYIYESVEKYKQTLDSLEQILEKYPIQLLITGHGDATTDKAEMYQRLQESRTYIEALEKAVHGRQAFDVESLFSRYQFPEIMSQFHAGNIALLKKELDF